MYLISVSVLSFLDVAESRGTCESLIPSLSRPDDCADSSGGSEAGAAVQIWGHCSPGFPCGRVSTVIALTLQTRGFSKGTRAPLSGSLSFCSQLPWPWGRGDGFLLGQVVQKQALGTSPLGQTPQGTRGMGNRAGMRSPRAPESKPRSEVSQRRGQARLLTPPHHAPHPEGR